MITEEQKKKYEESWNKLKRMGWAHEYCENGIINDKDAKKLYSAAHSEGWNEAIEKAIKISENRQDESTDNAEYLGHLKVIEELKRLKR